MKIDVEISKHPKLCSTFNDTSYCQFHGYVSGDRQDLHTCDLFFDDLTVIDMNGKTHRCRQCIEAEIRSESESK